MQIYEKIKPLTIKYPLKYKKFFLYLQDIATTKQVYILETSMKKFNLLLIITSIALLSQCTEKPAIDNKPSIGNKTARDILVYIVADNNLAYALDGDINEMESAWSESYDGRLFVLHNTGASTKLYRIKHDTDLKKINSDVVVNYPSDFDPCKKGALTEVMSYIQAQYKSEQHALILSSHGSGWLPSYQSTKRQTLDQHTKLLHTGAGNLHPAQAYNQDISQHTIGVTDSYGTEIELYDLAEMLKPFNKLEFIMFDACLMASVEGLHQLRNNTKYVMSSAAEILADGAPYTQMMPHMFAKNKPNVTSMATEFLNFYANQTNPILKSATISVVQTDKLEALADTISQIIPKISTQPYTTQNVQQFGRYQFLNTFYDLEDFIAKNLSDPASLNSLKTALNNAVIYKGATEYILLGSGGFKINTHCGLTTFVPSSEPSQIELSQKHLTIYNTKYEWGRDSDFSTLFAN